MSTALSVIVPVYNEENVLWSMAQDLSTHLDQIVGPGNWEWVLVDNGSLDRTPQIVRQIEARWPSLVHVHLDRPNYGRALTEGLAHANGEWAYIINVDFWDELFLRWAWLNRGQYDLILGSKRADPTLNRQQPYRKFLSWGLNTLLNLFFGFVGRDTHGQKVLRLASMLPILKRCKMERGQFDTEFTIRAIRAGLWIAEVPVPIVEKRKQRNLMVRKIVNNLWDILRLWRILRHVEYAHSVRYHRWSREDLEKGFVITWKSPDGDMD